MLQFRKKILITALCAGLLLTTCQSAWSESADNTAADGADAVQTSDSGNTEGESGEAGGEAESGNSEQPSEAKHITEEQALSQMKECAKTSSLALYVNEETAVFAVKNLSDGTYVWSNPYDSDNDSTVKSPTKKQELKSSLLINSVKVTDVETPSTTIRSAYDGETVVERLDNGFKATVTFPSQGITVPYYVTLTDDHFDIAVAMDEIYEVEFDLPGEIQDSTRSIVNLGLFPNLNAAYNNESGYFVIPDGSGAVINFNNGKSKTMYSQKIYGRDYSLSQDTAPKKTEQAYLPILGVVKENGALLEVITEGAAYATAKAALAGQMATGYNSAYFEFSVRGYDQYFMGAVNATALKAYEQSRIPEPRLSVRYYPIAKKNASYVDIAQRYQKYLLDEGLMSAKAGVEEAPLYVDFYGGTVKERSVMGLPVNMETAATTYDQAKMIIDSLRNYGVEQMVVTYNDFNKAGITNRISNGVGYSSTLGGKKAFKALQDYCVSAGITLAPSVDLMEFERSGNGYSKTGASVIGVTKAYATQGEYELAFGTPHDTRPSWFILTPAYYEKVYGEVASSFASEGIRAVSTGKGTSMLYSDYSQSSGKKTSRQQAVENLKKGYEKITSSGLKFVTSACNDYALKYADCIRDVPLYSSDFDITDYDIPFYQMVIHGYIPYTTKAKNASAGADELFLLSLATGTPMHYEFMYESPNELVDCKYDKLFYTHYEGWLSVAAEEYKCFKENCSGVVGAKITDFKYLSDKVVECKFDNNTTITADLENYSVKINGKEIQLPEKSWKGATND